MSTSKATFRIRRRPTTLDPADRAVLLADLHHRIAASWSISAALPPFARFFGAGWEEEVPLAALLDEGEDEKVAAILLRAAARPEVRAAFREGEGWVQRGEQKLRVVALLEICDVETLAWTLHLQRVPCDGRAVRGRLRRLQRRALDGGRRWPRRPARALPRVAGSRQGLRR